MQRIALILCVGLVTLCGCASQPVRQASPGHLPPPLLSTRTPDQVRPIPAPQPLRPIPHRLLPRPGITVTARDIQVPGGIKRSKWNIIVVHHSAAPTATPQSMHNYHKNHRKWCNGLGYHFVIGNGNKYPDGKLYVGPRWLKQQTGAHCKSCAGRFLGAWRKNNHYNEHGIGICLIGDFEKGYPTEKQLQTLQDLICVLVEEAGIQPDQIFGHGEVTHKTACPGRHMDMSQLRRNVVIALGRSTPTPTLSGGN